MRTRDTAGLARKCSASAERERLDVVDRILPRQRVDGVLHRVGREARPVVAVDVDRVERAFELDVDRQIDELVRIAGPPHLHQADPRLAVAIPGQIRHERSGDASCPAIRRSTRTG